MTYGIYATSENGTNILPDNFDTRRLVDVLIARAGMSGSKTLNIRTTEADAGTRESVLVLAAPMILSLQALASGHTVSYTTSPVISMDEDENRFYTKIEIEWAPSDFTSIDPFESELTPIYTYNDQNAIGSTEFDIDGRRLIVGSYGGFVPKQVLSIPESDTQIFIFA